jgi:hypothetical protein
MEIRTLRVLEITRKDLLGIPKLDLTNPANAIQAAGQLEYDAEIIIYRGMVIKNTEGQIFERKQHHEL